MKELLTIKVGVLVVLAQNCYEMTVDVSSIGKPDSPVKLRATDDRDAMVAAVRGEAAKLAKFAVVESPEAEGDTISVAEEPVVPVSTEKPDEVEIDKRLMSLVVKPINDLPEAKRKVKGKVRSGEEIARAIPDVEAFLNEVNLQNQDGALLDFFELNGTGQLVMKDDCPEAYGLSENALQARMRQTRIVYREEDDQTKVMTGEKCFKVTKHDKEGRPLEMEISEAAQKITTKSILMARGLPTLKWDGKEHTGEYARMNKGQFEKATCTWTDDDSLAASRARGACWDDRAVFTWSRVCAILAFRVLLLVRASC